MCLTLRRPASICGSLRHQPTIHLPLTHRRRRHRHLLAPAHAKHRTQTHCRSRASLRNQVVLPGRLEAQQQGLNANQDMNLLRLVSLPAERVQVWCGGAISTKMHDCKPVFVSKFNFLTISSKKNSDLANERHPPVAACVIRPPFTFLRGIVDITYFDLPRLERKAETEFIIRIVVVWKLLLLT